MVHFMERQESTGEGGSSLLYQCSPNSLCRMGWGGESSVLGISAVGVLGRISFWWCLPTTTQSDSRGAVESARPSGQGGRPLFILEWLRRTRSGISVCGQTRTGMRSGKQVFLCFGCLWQVHEDVKIISAVLVRVFLSTAAYIIHIIYIYNI